MRFREYSCDVAQRWRRVDARTIIETAVLMPATSLLLRRLGYNRTRTVYDVLAGFAAPSADSTGPAPDPYRLVHSIDVVAMRFAPQRTCLARAMVVDLLLRRAGFAPAVHVGVRSDGGAFGAHAWIELDNVVLGPAEHRYAPLGIINKHRRKPGA